MEQQYIAIDLKSFYASVECNERGLDPLSTHLVVADASRTDKTICLAVTPSLKAYGISGRARLFEVKSAVEGINKLRLYNAPHHRFSGSSTDSNALAADPSLALSFLTAVPRMAYYISYSSRIFDIYLRYVAPEDIHVYSIDEVFMDVTHYLSTYGISARELAVRMIRDVYEETHITATAGIGTNLYLCKIAMDIMAKHASPDENGARIAILDEMSYRRKLWSHRPLSDFWRVGRGYIKKLASIGVYTMGDIARLSLENEDILYRMFGVNAELLIDHAWGYEPVGMSDIKSYRPQSNSISSGQVLTCPYPSDKARLVTWEMTDALVLSLVDKKYTTDQLVLTVGYDISNLTDEKIAANYHGEITIDHYGRAVPKHAHGTANLRQHSSSSKEILDAVMALYDRIINPSLLIRRITIVAAHLMPATAAKEAQTYEQLDLFSLPDETDKTDAPDASDREEKMQQALLSIKKRYGKNAILRGANYLDGATARSRNEQIGGHKA